MTEKDLDAMKKLGSLSKEEAAKQFGKENIQDGFFTCKICGKQTPLRDTKLIDTPLVKQVVDATCSECRRNFDLEAYATIVCIGCKEVIARIKPQKDPATGFEIKKNHIYHIMDCPACNPEKFKDPTKAIPSKIVEADLYEKQFGKKVKL